MGTPPSPYELCKEGLFGHNIGEVVSVAALRSIQMPA
jgi:hypothetical protein